MKNPRSGRDYEAIMRVAVIGGGGWGTALACLLDSAGHEARVWVRREVLARKIEKTRENADYLPGVQLPETLHFTPKLSEAAIGVEALVIAVPSHAVRSIASTLGSLLTTTPLLVSTSKGIEQDSLQTMSGALTEALPPRFTHKIAVLSGPSFAAEVARGLPTAVTVAARDQAVARRIQTLFSAPTFRVYTTTDVIGAEIGGAVKNVIALAVGVSDGLGYGYNARAALITRGMAEVVRLATRMGAHPQTLSGLSGMGDLILTCTSDLSRNRTVGVRLGRGESLEAIQRTMATIAEGIRNCRSILDLARRLAVDMPIVEQIYELVYSGKPPTQVVTDLLARQTKAEFPPGAN